MEPTFAICPTCGRKTPLKVYESINSQEHPELKDAILDGSLFLWECPDCGHRNLFEFKFLYHDPVGKFLIWLTEGDRAIESLAKRVYEQNESLHSYTARFVNDAGSLIEKLKLFDNGLDDMAMEMCKHVTKMEMEKDIQLKFLNLDGADNDIILTYPSGGQMEMLKVGFNVYEDCRGILQRNPSVAESSTGFVRIDQEWISEFFG